MLKLSLERVGAIPPLPFPTLDRRVEVWRDNEGLIAAYGEVLGDEYRMHLPGLATFSFTGHRDEISACLTEDTREDLVVDAYFRKVLPLALQVRGREVLHASAVRFPTGVVALCGVSATGKSTIAFGLGRRGYGLWADDSVVLELSDRIRAVALPFNIKLRSRSAELFKIDSSATSYIQGRKEPLPEEHAPLSAICVLSKVPEAASPVSIRRLASAEAFANVLTHACCFTFDNAERKRRMMHHYLDLVATIRIFEIRFQTGLANLPPILDAIERIAEENT
ncbi:MAG TPA: hypothetical protein VEW46_10665 [Pyrinomonadaceae bacterium]|nr:hypothetical protein [Pyrinomonadaceae bacterium]